MMRLILKIGLFNLFILNQLILVYGQEIEYSKGSYHFFENKGQWPEQVLYKTDLDGGKIWLEENRVLYQWQDFSELHHAHDHPGEHQKDEFELKQDLVAANFVNCNSNITTERQYPTKYYENYFLGNDPSHWASEVRGYNHVKYKSLYEGVDLLFFEKDLELKYEFQLAPNADPSQIKIQYEGHKKLKLNREGDLTIIAGLGQIVEKKPYAYQIKNGKFVEVPCSFRLEGDVVSFELEDYDKSLALIIDPILVFATYCGSTSDNFGMTATYAYDGKGYSAGMIYGPSYPCPDPDVYNCTSNITTDLTGSQTTDVFVSKYSEDGTEMLWTNFIGGGDNTQGTETVHSLICDTSNNVYLYGATSSTDFPIVGGFQTLNNGGTLLNVVNNGVNCGSDGTDIYVAKISEDGSDLLGSTYIGGTGNDGVNYRPSAIPYNSAIFYDSLVTNYGDQFRGEIMLDSSNNILIASSTRSDDFPVSGGFQMSPGGQQDAVIFKISADFSTLMWSSYYGGSANDAGFSVKIDSSFNVILAGGTSSTNLPNTTGGFQPAYAGGPTDGYVAKISSDGSTMIQSTYVGTDDYDNVFFAEIDRWDNVYVLGQSEGDMPVSPGVYNNAGSSQFIWKLMPSLAATDYTTVFGSGDGDIDISPSAFLVDFCGNVYVSGWGANILASTELDDMPTTADAYQEESPNGFDFYMIVLENDAEDIIYGSYMGGDDSNEHVDGGTSRFDKYGVVYQSVCGGCGGNSDFPTTSGAWSATNDATNCNNLLFKFDFEIVPKAQFTLDTLEGCAPLNITVSNSSTDTINYDWTFPPGVTVITPGINPEIVIDVPGTYEIILTIEDTICNLTDTAKKTITVYPALELYVPDDTIICELIDPWDLTANTNGTATSVTWSTNLSFDPPLNTPGVDSTITVAPTEGTTYYVMATNGWPLCDLIDSVQVLYVDGAINMMPDTIVCLGSDANLYVTNLIPEIPVTYEWEPMEYISNIDGGTATGHPPESMWFYVTAETETGCIVRDSAYVTVAGIDPSTISATADPTSVLEYGTTVLTTLPAGYSYQWEPVEGVTNPNNQITEAQIVETTTFEVTISDGLCDYRTQVTVTALEFICGDVYIYVPSAFSPDANNENDVLYVYGQNIEEMEWKIFDRWGEKVFESNDQSDGWDGTYKGRPLDPDVYVYHLKVKCADNQENLIKGNITILR
ncbi:MAG: gliding motility-associated C-terminal domain-containing protein [Flavobacteriales bacterium]|nr:gliding motility-associated C-terminal domain-containing protein [Flavobacteriales bacterium]